MSPDCTRRRTPDRLCAHSRSPGWSPRMGSGSASAPRMRGGTGAAPVSVGRSAANARPTLRRESRGWLGGHPGRAQCVCRFGLGSSPQGVPRGAARPRCGRQQPVTRDQPQRAGVRCRSRERKREMRRRFAEGRRSHRWPPHGRWPRAERSSPRVSARCDASRHARPSVAATSRLRSADQAARRAFARSTPTQSIHQTGSATSGGL